jgi:hypothetical protein
MHQHRATPFDLVFETAAQTSFPAIRSALAAAGHDPRDRDAFLMTREVVALLRELRPDEGLGEGIDQLAALVHHGYLFWAGGSFTLELSRDTLTALLTRPAEVRQEAIDPPAFYTQLPERRVWAQVVPGEPHEPLDGCFQYEALEPGVLRVLGVFGIHADRPGFSVVEVSGSRPRALARSDGSPLYSPTLPGGAAAGLFSLAGEEELLELGWRVSELGAGSWESGAMRSGRAAPSPALSSQLPAPDSKLPAPSS